VAAPRRGAASVLAGRRRIRGRAASRGRRRRRRGGGGPRPGLGNDLLRRRRPGLRAHRDDPARRVRRLRHPPRRDRSVEGRDGRRGGSDRLGRVERRRRVARHLRPPRHQNVVCCGRLRRPGDPPATARRGASACGHAGSGSCSVAGAGRRRHRRRAAACRRGSHHLRSRRSCARPVDGPGARRACHARRGSRARCVSGRGRRNGRLHGAVRRRRRPRRCVARLRRTTCRSHRGWPFCRAGRIQPDRGVERRPGPRASGWAGAARGRLTPGARLRRVPVSCRRLVAEVWRRLCRAPVAGCAGRPDPDERGSGARPRCDARRRAATRIDVGPRASGTSRRSLRRSKGHPCSSLAVARLRRRSTALPGRARRARARPSARRARPRRVPAGVPP
jgi:hypothetical protein